MEPIVFITATSILISIIAGLFNMASVPGFYMDAFKAGFMYVIPWTVGFWVVTLIFI